MAPQTWVQCGKGKTALGIDRFCDGSYTISEDPPTGTGSRIRTASSKMDLSPKVVASNEGCHVCPDCPALRQA